MKEILKNQIRKLLTLFIAALCISGITASFIETELSWIQDNIMFGGTLGRWLEFVLFGIKQTNSQYPFIAYSADWLAFSHLALALFFIGPLRKPVDNRWVVVYGIVICIGVFPLAFIAGYFRGIPLFWQLIDCSFGLFGGTLLWVILKKVDKLALKLETGNMKLNTNSPKMEIGRKKFDSPRLTTEI